MSFTESSSFATRVRALCICTVALGAVAFGGHAAAQTESDSIAGGAVRLVDLTGDGRADKLHEAADGNLTVFVNHGGRVFMPVDQVLPAVDVADVLTGDLDGDGLTDLYLVSPGTNIALLGDGTGRFTVATERLGLADAGTGVSAERIDLDGVSPDELLLHNAAGDVVFWSTGSGFERDADTPHVSNPTAHDDLVALQTLVTQAAELLSLDPGQQIVLGMDAAGQPQVSLGQGTTGARGAASPAGSQNAATGLGGGFAGGSSPVLTLEEKRILNLMSLVPLDDGFGNPVNTTIRITGANLQIVNGLGTTDTSNGKGNLIVGYNELGTNPNGDDRTGSHNIVGGWGNSYSGHGGLVVGADNTIGNQFNSVLGGNTNVATGGWSAILGGSRNEALANASAIAGGDLNQATGINGSVCGGQGNNAEGGVSWVGGGVGNHALADASSISGGAANLASGLSSSVSGGNGNIASGYESTVSGGHQNEANEKRSSVSGGFSNTAGSFYASVSGGSYNTAAAVSSSVSGGRDNNANGVESSVSGGSGNTTTDLRASVSGGKNNFADGENSSISGGRSNDTSANFASVSGGRYNTASFEYASVSGGRNNTASAADASVSGGSYNTAAAGQSSVSGGTNNLANGVDSSVSGGSQNTAEDRQSSVSGGHDNFADGEDSSILGGTANDTSADNATVSGGSSNVATGVSSSVSGGTGRTAAGLNDWVAGSLFEDF